MVAASVGAVGTQATEATSTFADVPAPPSVVAGKGVIVCLFLDGAAQTVTPPDGTWQEAPNAPVNVTGGSHGLHVFWHRAAGSEAGPYTFTWGSSTFRAGHALRIDDMVASGNPFDTPCGAAEDNTIASTSPPVSTTSLDVDRCVVWVSTNWSGGTQGSAWTPPTGFTEHFEALYGTMTAASKALPTAGSTGSVTGTCTGSDRRTAWIGAIIGTTVGGSVVGPGARASALHPGRGPSRFARFRQSPRSFTITKISGILTATMGPITAAMSATVKVAGTLAATLPSTTAAMVARAIVRGAAATTLPSLTTTVAGRAIVRGTASSTLPSVTTSISARAVVRGALGATLPSASAQLAATVRVGGVLSVTLPSASTHAAAQSTVRGGLVGVLPSMAVQGLGMVRVSGSLSAALPSLTIAFGGVVHTPDSLLIVVLPSAGSAAAGRVVARGTILVTLPPSGMAATATVTVHSALTAPLPSLTVVMTGTVTATTNHGSLAAGLPAVTVTMAAHVSGGMTAVLQATLPSVVAGRWRDGEIMMVLQRVNTLQFILAMPIEIILIPVLEVKAPSGGTQLIDQPARAPQLFRLIPMSHTERPVRSIATTGADAGQQRRYDYTLLGQWDAIMQENDWWQDESGQCWIIDALVSYNGYERKGLVTSYGRRPRHGN